MAERRAVHAVAGDVLTIDDDFTEIDADPIPDLAHFWNACIARRHRLLNRDGDVDGADHAGELHQRAIDHQFDDAAVIFGGLGFNRFFAKRLELRKRPRIVGGHQPAVADDVRT